MTTSSKRSVAMQLRRDGTSYRLLQQRFGVAKSTLWRWLKVEGLVASQPQQITELRRAAQRKGAATVKALRIARTQLILQEARREIDTLSRRDLWMLGLALYWGEGSKQKPGNVSAGVIFTNSDPLAVRLFVAWVRDICGVSDGRLHYEIYLHDTADAERARNYWATQLDIPVERLSQIRWKRHRPATRRTNIGDSYHGLVRVKAACSSALNRRIAGWIAGVNDVMGSGVMATLGALDPAFQVRILAPQPDWSR